MKDILKFKKEVIRDFSVMQSRLDFLELLNKVKKEVICGDSYEPFTLRQLTYYANPKRNKKEYHPFDIPKKSGGSRTIYAPSKGLKLLQQSIAWILHCVYTPNASATGFVKGKSIVDNAKLHTRSNYVFNLDLKDFFPSIDQARVWACLKLPPFDLVDSPEVISNPTYETGFRFFITDHQEKIYYRFVRDKGLLIIMDKQKNYHRYKKRIEDAGEDFHKDVIKYILTEENVSQIERLKVSRLSLASMIAGICCTEILVQRRDTDGKSIEVVRNVLPQGAPTSPILSNIICNRLDRILTGVAKRFGLRYSRYADDITFSSEHNVYQNNSLFIRELYRVIADQGFQIKVSKTRLQKNGYRKEVTGLLVNDEVNVQKRFIKELRMWLYYWESYGYKRTSSYFFSTKEGEKPKQKYKLLNVLSGKLAYLKMIKGEKNSMYQKLYKRFKVLEEKENAMEEIITIWEQHGIERAMSSSLKIK